MRRRPELVAFDPKTVLRRDAQGHLVVLTSSPIRRGLWNAFTVPGGRRSELPRWSTLAAVPTGTRYSPLFEGTSQLAEPVILLH